VLLLNRAWTNTGEGDVLAEEAGGGAIESPEAGGGNSGDRIFPITCEADVV